MKLYDKSSKVMKDLTKKHLITAIKNTAVPKIKESIISDYNMMLNGRVTDRRSRTAPEDYMDDFVSRLENFNYIKSDDIVVTLVVPDLNNFDFSGRLRVVKDILEGTAGSYVELDMDQLEQIYKKKPITVEYVDPFLPQKERLVKLRKTIDVINRLRSNRIEIVDYPFSNTPPIDIFSNTKEYVEKDLLSNLINSAIGAAKKEFVDKFKG